MSSYDIYILMCVVLRALVFSKYEIIFDTRHIILPYYCIPSFKKERQDLILLNNMLKVASLALVLIQYTLYNRLIVVSTVLFSISFWKDSDTSWLQVKKKENKNCNWNTFTQFVKQYLKTKKKKKRKRTLSSITLSSFLWKGGGGWW